MKRTHQAWHAGAKGIVVSLALVVLGYQIVKPQLPAWPLAGEGRSFAVTGSALGTTSTPAPSTEPSTLPSTALAPHTFATGFGGPRECAPSQGIVEGCTYQ
jgi:hypothetical protein